MKHMQYIVIMMIFMMPLGALASENATMRLGKGSEPSEEPKRRSLVKSEVRYKKEKKQFQSRHQPADPQALAAGGRKGRKARQQQARYEAEQRKIAAFQAKEPQQTAAVEFQESKPWFSVEQYRNNRKERVAQKNAEINAQLAELRPDQSRKRLKLERRKLHDWTTFSEMNVQELLTTKNKLSAQGSRQSTIKFIEEILPICDDLDKIHDLMLEVADLYFDEGQLPKAEKVYNEFTILYPGSEHVEYCLYKAILCAYYATLTVDRDQTKTVGTLELTERFLQNDKMFTTYLAEVQRIDRECVTKLAEHELYVAHYYINKGVPSSLRAAQTRLTEVRNKYLIKLPQVEKGLLKCEVQIARASNNEALCQEKEKELLTKYPEAVYEDSRRGLARHRRHERVQLAHAKKDEQKFGEKKPVKEKTRVHFARRF